MPYEPSLDETIFIDTIPGDEQTRGKMIELKMCRYDCGPPKLQLSRVEKKGTKTYHAKLGRMTQIEIADLRDKLTELLDIDLDAIETPRTKDAADAQKDFENNKSSGNIPPDMQGVGSVELPPDSEIPF